MNHDVIVIESDDEITVREDANDGRIFLLISNATASRTIGLAFDDLMAYQNFYNLAGRILKRAGE